jgi:hypothetical protein
VVTGVTATKEDLASMAEPEWTADELKSGKPMMVYYYIAVDPKDTKAIKAVEEDYNFSRKAETSAFSGESTVQAINTNWVPQKIEIDAASDRKDEKNHARIEFWSFTGKKMDVITLKNSQFLAGGEFDRRLKSLDKKNREICNLEIKRIHDEEARRKAEEATASK